MYFSFTQQAVRPEAPFVICQPQPQPPVISQPIQLMGSNEGAITRFNTISKSPENILVSSSTTGLFGQVRLNDAMFVVGFNINFAFVRT